MIRAATHAGSLDIAGVGSIFEENARKLTQLLTEHMQLQVYPCESGYFVIADVQRTGTCLTVLNCGSVCVCACVCVRVWFTAF